MFDMPSADNAIKAFNKSPLANMLPFKRLKSKQETL
jgi:hypothetical protein